MKKKLSYRDKLVELAYIYDVKEIKDYEKSRKNLIRNFIKNILENKKNKFTVKNQIDLMSACLYADKSMNTGKELKIRYLNS